MSQGIEFEQLVALFKQTHLEMQHRAARAVDTTLLVRNWLFGWYIVEYEQSGVDRADYGSRLLPRLSDRLKQMGIKGSSNTRLKLYRSFYLHYKTIGPAMSDQLHSLLIGGLTDIGPTASDQLSSPLGNALFSVESIIDRLVGRFDLGWSHYVTLLTIGDADERKFYEIEAAANGWSVRELERQIASSLYQRLALSRNKDEIRRLSREGQVPALSALQEGTETAIGEDPAGIGGFGGRTAKMSRTCYYCSNANKAVKDAWPNRGAPCSRNTAGRNGIPIVNYTNVYSFSGLQSYLLCTYILATLPFLIATGGKLRDDIRRSERKSNRHGEHPKKNTVLHIEL